MPNDPIKGLTYQFGDADLLALAMRHRSAGNPHNERLEFLGDAVIGLLVADQLVATYADADEGELTRMRSFAVKRASLAKIARQLNLGSYLQIGQGEENSGGRNRESTLANALEALIGAIYLDGGIESVRRHILPLFELAVGDAVSATQKDSKTSLQELLQREGHPLPAYQVIACTGDPHRPQFNVSCEVPSLTLTTTALGPGKRKAEQRAAQSMLDLLAERFGWHG